MYAGRIVEIGPPQHAVRRAAASVHPRAARRGAGVAGRACSTAIGGTSPRPAGARRAALRLPLRRGAHARAATPSRRPSSSSPATRCAASGPQIRSADTGDRRRVTGRADGRAAAARCSRVARSTPATGAPQVLSGSSLEVRPRECVAVVGESGSGKTTLARCDRRASTATGRGEISLHGEPLVPGAARPQPQRARRRSSTSSRTRTPRSTRARPSAQIVAQPLEHFSGCRAGERAERVAGALERVSLPRRRRRRYPDQLSGGERQRVAIARALAGRARPADLRRGDLGARRLRPGGDRAAARLPPRAPLDPVRHARPCARPLDRRPRHRPRARGGRRDRHRRRGDRPAAAAAIREPSSPTRRRSPRRPSSADPHQPGR